MQNKHTQKEFAFNLHDKTEYVIHIKNLKQTLNHELAHRFHEFIE